MNFSFCYRKPCVKAASYNISPFLYLRYTSGLDNGAWDPAITFQKLQGFNLTLYPGFFLFNTNPQPLQLRLAFSTVQFPDLHSPWSIIMIKVKALKIRTV